MCIKTECNDPINLYFIHSRRSIRCLNKEGKEPSSADFKFDGSKPLKLVLGQQKRGKVSGTETSLNVIKWQQVCNVTGCKKII